MTTDAQKPDQSAELRLVTEQRDAFARIAQSIIARAKGEPRSDYGGHPRVFISLFEDELSELSQALAAPEPVQIGDRVRIEGCETEAEITAMPDGECPYGDHYRVQWVDDGTTGLYPPEEFTRVLRKAANDE